MDAKDEKTHTEFDDEQKGLNIWTVCYQYFSII